MCNKLRYSLLFIFCMFLLPSAIFAKCDFQRNAELLKIAKNVQFSYTYHINEENVPIFNIILSNSTGDIYITDNYGNIVDDNSINDINYPDGKSIKFTIYSNDSNCHGDKLFSKYVSLPKYNVYSRKEECSEYPNFKYCRLWLDSNIVDSDFYDELESYKNGVQKMSVEDDFKVNDTSFIFIVLCTSLFALIAIFLLIKKVHR